MSPSASQWQKSSPPSSFPFLPHLGASGLNRNWAGSSGLWELQAHFGEPGQSGFPAEPCQPFLIFLLSPTEVQLKCSHKMSPCCPFWLFDVSFPAFLKIKSFFLFFFFLVKESQHPTNLLTLAYISTSAPRGFLDGDPQLVIGSFQVPLPTLLQLPGAMWDCQTRGDETGMGVMVPIQLWVEVTQPN